MSESMGDKLKEQAVTNAEIRADISTLSERFINLDNKLDGYIQSSNRLMNRNSDRIEELKITVALQQKELESLRKDLDSMEETDVEVAVIKRDLIDLKKDMNSFGLKFDAFIEKQNQFVMKLMWKIVTITIGSIATVGVIGATIWTYISNLP